MPSTISPKFNRPLFLAFALLALLPWGSVSLAQYKQVEMPVEQLPNEHEYQKQLRTFMASLTEKDFAVDVAPLAPPATQDPEEAYRFWLLSLYPPAAPPVSLPASAFTLKAIESQKGLALPLVPSMSQLYAWWAKWDYPGNPYHGSRAVKLRAFMLAATDTVMLDYLYEHNPQGANRSDYLGGNLIWIGYTYSVVKDVLPPEARAAFEAGIKKHVARLGLWGPTGQMTDMDLFAPVSLGYISTAMGDAQTSKAAQDYARQLFTQPRYFNPAGYFVDNGCFDTSYNGISLYFSTWLALAGDWDFVHDAVDKAYRLRAHLCFPDPGGLTFSGPSHMSSRTSGDPPRDQWNFPHRPYGAAMATDEALYLAKLPAPEVLKNALANLVTKYNDELTKPATLQTQVWKESHWSGVINFAYEHYKPGYYQRRLKLEQENSPLLKPLYEREGNFIHTFGKAFVISRFDHYAAALFTGPVGRAVGHGGRPYGYGGGQLSVFWTPESGVVIAGRRRGVQGAVFDTYDEWRDWPNHEVIGLTAKNELVSSARIQVPEVSQEVTDQKAQVKAGGIIPKYNAERSATSDSGLHYERTFECDGVGVKIKTQVTSDGQEQFSELYETIPVFVRETADQAATTIEVRSGKAWAEAKAGKNTGVLAVRLKRFTGAVVIAFAQPQTVLLSEKAWKDGFQTQAECRNLRIDLLDGKGSAETPVAIKTASVEYTISDRDYSPPQP